MDAPQPPTEPRAAKRPGPLCRLLTQVKRLLVLAVIVALVALAGKYYWFDRLNEEIRVRIERQLREHYPKLAVSVRSARRVPGQGVEIRGVRIAEPGNAGRTLVEIDEVSAECDTRLPDFVTRSPDIKSLRIVRLKLRAERTAAGQWNLAQLLPLPSCSSQTPPIATISDASFEIVDATQNPPCTWTLRNIQLSIAPEATAPAADNAVLALRGSIAGDYLDKVTIGGSLDLRTGAWQLDGDVEGLEFSPRLRHALPRELSESLVPLSSVRGRTHFHFAVGRTGGSAPPASAVREAGGMPSRNKPLPPVQFLVQGQIAEGRIDDARLPEPLTDVTASLRCDNRGVTIEQLAARCGHTQIALTARIDGYDAASPFRSELNVKQLSLDRLNEASLPAELQEVWQRFSPRGTIDLTGKLAFDGSRFVPDFTVRCRDLSVEYDRHPYRVTDGTGTIRVQTDFISVRLRTIGGGGRTIECRADVRQPGPHFTGWIEVQTEGPIPIEDRLLAALEPSAQKVVRAFQPRGAASFQLRMERDPGDPVCHRKLSVQLHDCSIQHKQFPYPIDKVGGSLELTDDNWVFRNLSGRNDSAYIVGAGSWASDAAGQSLLDLKFTATDVPLADELRQAVSPETQRLWANLRPRGNIDHLTVGLRYDGTQTALEVDAQKWPPEQNTEGRTLSIEPMWFRYRLDNLTGSFRYRDGVLKLSNLDANHGRTSLAAEGICRDLGNGSSRLELSRLAADRVEIDEALLAAVPARLSQALSRLTVTGSLNVLGRLGMTVPAGSDAPPALDWDLSLNLAGGSIRTNLPIEHVHGGLRLVGGSGPKGVVTRGELSVDSAMVRGVQLTNIQGPLWTDGERLVFGPRADAGQKTPRQLTADIFEGQLVTEGEVALSDDGRFHVEAALENSNLAQMARQLAPRQSGLSGRVFGVATITGTAEGRHTWRGGGKLRLRDADIYEVPAMVAMLKLLSVQRPDRTAFSTSEIDFRIEGDDLALERIDFSGDAISLKGEGRVNMERQVSLKFYPVMGREERQIPLFRPLLGETGKQFMLIEVTGTLDRPDFHRTMLPKLDDRLRELFPELAREELVEPAMPILTAPREALDRLNLLPKR